jgi:hypothetical protein
MADDLGLSADDIPNVKKAMKSLVDGQMQAGDLVSIMTTSGGVGAMQQLHIGCHSITLSSIMPANKLGPGVTLMEA